MDEYMKKAAQMACELLQYPTDSKYDEKIRQYQGCPTIALTKKGRIYLGWYSGGRCEPHMDNYNLLVYSDDGGKSWTKPILVIPSSRERCVQALDIQLWTAPDGRLFVFWVQNNTFPAEEGAHTKLKGVGITANYVDGYVFGDFTHAEWLTVCDDPDADRPVFSQPRYLDKGFLRCKPLVMENGDWLNCNYDQDHDRYGYSISHDCGVHYEHRYGAQKLDTPFDETMAYQRRDGSICMLARTAVGEIAQTISYDNAQTWTQAKKTGIPNPNTRLFVSRTPSGRILLVNNDHSKYRCNMTVYLSEDDGTTWKYKRCLDERMDISYPDADFYGGKIYLTYDRERTGAKEILLCTFTEEDIMDPARPVSIQVVSKP